MDEQGPEAATGVGSLRIFMSYRRADDRHFIGRLHDRLCDAFGEEMVFRDIDSIPAGTNFRNVILRTLNEVDAVVAIIGPQWSRSSAADPAVADTDYVFLELAEALREGKPMIPVLIEDTEMPSPDALPADLRALSDINAISVHGDPAFRRDSTRLIEAIGAVVAENRTRIARELLDAEERKRQLEADRLERERVAEELRAEERAARVRLAELEEAATRHQIEQERARLADIEARLRRAEPAVEAASDPVPAPPPTIEPTVEPAAERVPIGQQRPLERVDDPAPSPQMPPKNVAVPWFQILIIAALILGVIAVSLDRTVNIDGSTSQFNELAFTSTVDVLAWILTLVVAVPLLLGQRPVEQRFVLLGVTASTFFYEFLQASAGVKYGSDGYDEGSWTIVKILELGCLVAACRMVRKRSGDRLSATVRQRAALMAVAIASSVIVVAATVDQWSHARSLIDDSKVPDRTPVVIWLLLVALPPVATTVVLAVRGTYAACGSLATLATLGVASYLGEAAVQDNFGIDGSPWKWAALSQLVLAGVAGFVTITLARSVASPASERALHARPEQGAG